MIAKFFSVACCVVLVSGNVGVDQQTSSGYPQTTQQFPQHAVLDVNELVRLYWEHNDTHITFEVHAQTTGWVGIGISPSGSMVNADIHVGWVKNGVATLTDRHGLSTENSFPPKDREENLELLEGRECDGWTIIKFRRQLAACQADEDKEITSDTLRLIYAIGANDPTGNDITASDQHMTNKRGLKSILLLDQTGSATSQPAGETYQSFELLNNNFSVPAMSTYYDCHLLEMPTFPNKQHVVKVEPVVQAGHEFNVHHIVVYQCTENVTVSESIGAHTQCLSANMPEDFHSCSFMIHMWAIGGGSFDYPPHVGFPLGEPDSPKYVVVELHYDNPDKRSDIVDSSGLRFTYTSNLRQYDAGVTEVGHTISSFTDIIPPNVESFLDSGECTDQCLSTALASNNRSEVNVFAAILHAHSIGNELTLKHIRNATELPHIAQDRSYDFNFQETRHLQKERVVKSGDTIQVVCSYNSLDRTNITLGGLGVTEEMCLSFIYYYPKISLSFCVSQPEIDPLMSYFGITEVNFTKGYSFPATLYDVQVLAPAEYVGKSVAEIVNAISWNETNADAFAEAARKMQKRQYCGGENKFLFGENLTHPALEINQTYTTPALTCTSPSQGFNLFTDVNACPTTTTPMVTTTSGASSSFSLAVSFMILTNIVLCPFY